MITVATVQLLFQTLDVQTNKPLFTSEQTWPSHQSLLTLIFVYFSLVYQQSNYLTKWFPKNHV